MTNLNITAAFLIGLAGSVHCFGMCGGVVSAFHFAVPKGAKQWPYVFTYNLGRIASYALLGALTGYLGSMVERAEIVQSIPILHTISALFLIAMACYVGNWWRGLHYLERAGAKLWRYVRPLSKSLLPFKHPLYALPYGIIWGWLPCGLVYSTLTWSLASGSAINGALVMLFFGLGTLPALIVMAAGVESMKTLLTNPKTRQIVALCLLGFALHMLWRAYV
ncbi:MAG: sulfite exporter TauE/SafE family protein [Paraglaciecola chathamensis]